MTRHSFIQMSKLSNVKGRISYITSPARQENLYATYHTADAAFWTSLARENQQEFKRSGTEGTCIEAREFIIALPEKFTRYDPQRVLTKFTEEFQKRYNVECVSGLHHNKAKTNYHIHLIFSERRLLPEPVVKVATRNMFYDEVTSPPPCRWPSPSVPIGRWPSEVPMNYNKATFDRAFGISAQLPPADGIEIAFAGRSNVGKSSLLNRLFNRKSLARVSSVPGKTVTVNFYDVDGVHFVDLPGYGYAKISKAEKKRFGELMEGYFQSGRPIRLVVQLIDMRHAPTADDLQMIDFLQQIGLPFVVVLTKADKLKPTQYKKRLEELGTELPNLGTGVQVIPFSSVKGQGSEQLKAVIEQACQSE